MPFNFCWLWVYLFLEITKNYNQHILLSLQLSFVVWIDRHWFWKEPRIDQWLSIKKYIRQITQNDHKKCMYTQVQVQHYSFSQRLCLLSGLYSFSHEFTWTVFPLTSNEVDQPRHVSTRATVLLWLVSNGKLALCTETPQTILYNEFILNYFLAKCYRNMAV